LRCARRATRDGAHIVIAAKTSDPYPRLPGTIHTAARAIEAAGGQALPLVVDIRHEDQVVGAVEKAVARFGASTSASTTPARSARPAPWTPT